MWILDWLPAIVFYLLLAAGLLITIAGFFMGMIPLISKYKIPLQIFGILILAGSLYMIGRTENEEKWQARVDKLQAEVRAAETRAAEVSATIVTKYVTRREVVEKRGQEIVKYVDREVVKYDNKCEIPKIVIDIHNAAARNEPLPQSLSLGDPDPVATPETPVKTDNHNSAALRMPRRATQ